MRAYDIILKKRQGMALTKEEIDFFVEGYTKGDIPDYQASALLMAIMFNNLSKEETAHLTMAMAQSGDMLDLSQLQGTKVDKHSTGGVGDKVSIVVGPIVASLGVPVAKMSGRGLGHTGGTADKLVAIPGYRTEISEREFIAQVQAINIAMISQTGNIAPADKKLYALRDVTATVDNTALIAASIMSKKLASGADAFVLDVKVGSGAFAKTKEWATELANAMVEIAEQNGKKAVALLTNMSQPLGNAVGNWLEIVEVIETLQGNGPEDLRAISVEIAGHMLVLAGKGDIDYCKQLAKDAIANGSGLQKFREMVHAQGGDVSFIDDVSKYPQAKYVVEYTAKATGYIYQMDTEACGIASVMLGAGREKIDDVIDNAAGIVFEKKLNDYVVEGDVVAVLHTEKEGSIAMACGVLDRAVEIRAGMGEDVKYIHNKCL